MSIDGVDGFVVYTHAPDGAATFWASLTGRGWESADFTVYLPAGPVEWTVPLLLLVEAQDGPACRSPFHARPEPENALFIRLALPDHNGGEDARYWLPISGVEAFVAARLNAHLDSLTGGVR